MTAAYRIEDLARLSGTTVRTIRAYQDRGLLPKPTRRGRANIYDETHLVRLRQTADLLERGYGLASIGELLDAWDTGRGLSGVLGLVAEVDGPWTDESPERLTRAELDSRFGGHPDDDAVTEAVALHILVPVPEHPDTYLVPSPQELAVVVELYTAGVPLAALTAQLRELRSRVEEIAGSLLDFTTEHVFARYGVDDPSDADPDEAAGMVRKLRPLTRHTVDAELARAMRPLVTRHLRHRLHTTIPGGRAPHGSPSAEAPAPGRHPADPEADGSGRAGSSPSTAGRPVPERGPRAAPASGEGTGTPVTLPEETVRAVRGLVGAEATAAFIAAAAEREVRARRMDRLTPEAR